MEPHQDDIIIKLDSPKITQPEITQPTFELINSNSPISSPSHEFSFTISLDSSAPKTLIREPASPVDLTPADDIFFHGHLLPLHFLSHIQTSSTRSSTNSRDNAPFPKPETQPINPTWPNKPFSLFNFPKWAKPTSEKPRKPKFDVTQFVKRYIRMVKPILTTKGRNSYSFSSASLTPRGSKSGEYRRGLFSAPVSMRTSPTNSRVFLPGSGDAGMNSCLSESSMDELHSAIQAAIAHCKNSTSRISDSKVECKADEDLLSPVPVN